MQITRIQVQWRTITIFNEQQVSGLTIIYYCLELQLVTSIVNVFRKNLGITSSSCMLPKVT